MTTPMTLAERRAALKRLLAAGERTIDAYERVLEGASEKDRRSLCAPRSARRRAGGGRPRGHGVHVRVPACSPGRER